MTVIRALVAASVLIAAVWTGWPLTASAAQPPEQQTEYVPINELPPEEQLPAARLLIGAYVFVPVALFLYLLSLSRRMSSVQREVERLEADIKRSRA